MEPQFVLAADDSKNIFARPSTSPLNEMIEGSDSKKPGTAGSRKRKTKKVVVKRKVKDSRPGTANSGQNGEDSGDDGFRNYDGTSAPRVASPPDSATKSMNDTNRSQGFGDASNSTTRKLNNVPLERIDSD